MKYSKSEEAFKSDGEKLSPLLQSPLLPNQFTIALRTRKESCCLLSLGSTEKETKKVDAE